MAHSGKAVSLVSPEAITAAKRRARAGIDVTGSPDIDPTSSDPGYNTKSARWLQITVELPDATTTLDWELWLWDHVSAMWCLDTRLGTDGTVSITDADADNPQINLVEIPGVEKVFIKLDNGTGVFTNGANVWLAGIEHAILA